MFVKLQVDRLSVSVETDYKPAVGERLFNQLLQTAIDHMKEKIALCERKSSEKKGGGK